MPRCKKYRCCRRLGRGTLYKPAAIPLRELEVFTIGLDEFEAMRLCDFEGLDQTAAGGRMGISRGTVQRLLAAGRRKLIEALLEPAAFQISNANEEGAETDENLYSNPE